MEGFSFPLTCLPDLMLITGISEGAKLETLAPLGFIMK